MDLRRKKIFIAGHKGLVGSSILKEMKRRNIEPITIEKHELDLLDQYNVDKWFRVNKPEMVILVTAPNEDPLDAVICVI